MYTVKAGISVLSRFFAKMASTDDSATVQLPGLRLPIDFMPPRDKHFPVLVGLGTRDSYGIPPSKDWDYRAVTLLLREACMLKLMEELSNKPEWWAKVHNEDIVAKWKAEALAMDWDAFHQFADFTPQMFDAVSFSASSSVLSLLLSYW